MSNLRNYRMNLVTGSLVMKVILTKYFVYLFLLLGVFLMFLGTNGW
jgi:hypothetical protein